MIQRLLKGFGQNRPQNQLLRSYFTLGGPGDIDFVPVWTYLRPQFIFIKIKDLRIPNPPLSLTPPFSTSEGCGMQMEAKVVARRCPRPCHPHWSPPWSPPLWGRTTVNLTH